MAEKQPKSAIRNITLATLAAVVTIMGTGFAISTQFVSVAQFTEFKNGTVGAVDARLSRIEQKLDRLAEQQAKH